jgi:hypothetical protein
MDNIAAKRILSLYREGVDDDDPRFAEALDQAECDPELGEWLRQQQENYGSIRAKLRRIEPPAGLREKILRQRPIPFSRPNIPLGLKLAAGILILAGMAAAMWLHRSPSRAMFAQSGEQIRVTGEVLDMACYIASNLHGPEHAECARACIKKGLPVGIKSERDGKVYLLVGVTTSLNDQLADYAAKTITVEGKLRTRDGFIMLDDVTVTKL